MYSLSRKTFLIAAALAPLLASAPFAIAQTVTTFGLKLPNEVTGLRYSGAWPVTNPDGRKAVVAGYDGGKKGEAVAMIFEEGSAPKALDAALLKKERDYFVARMEVSEALKPKVAGEATVTEAGLANPLATQLIKTEFAGEKNDQHFFVTAINGRLVGIRYKAAAGANTTADAKAFSLHLAKALQAM